MTLERARSLFTDAIASFERGDFAGSEALLSRAFELQPDRLSIVTNLCAALLAQGKTAEALPFAERVCRLNPASMLAWEHAAHCHAANGNRAAEADCLAQALELGADVGCRRRRVSALLALKREEEACAELETLCKARTPEVADLVSLAEVLLRLDRPRKARGVALDATELDASLWQVWHVLGMAEIGCNDTTAAVAAFDRALRLAGKDPGELRVRWSRAQALLLAGDYERGWKAFECRRERPELQYLNWPASPVWSGREALLGRTLLLVSEPDPRDTLQFCRYAAPLAAAGARVELWVEPELQALLDGLPGVAAVHPKTLPPPPHDFHVPLPSLPLACGTTLETMPPPVAPSVDPARAVHWARQLAILGRPRIGLAWAGEPASNGDRARRLPLRMLAPLFGMRADFVSLQKFVREDERARLASLPVLDLAAQLRDLADLAALIDGLDLVIAVDSLSAHLAASLGKQVWLLLPHAAEWRWLRTRQDSPWYPSIRLFRQERPGEWDEVIDRLRRALGGREWDASLRR